MTAAPDQPVGQRYTVVPLSVQPEGDDFLVGNADLEEFFQLPAEGVRILTMLRDGATLDAIAASFADRDEAPIDVADFVDSMIEVGFVYPGSDAPRMDERHAERVAAAPRDRRLVFRANRRVAAAIFSPAMLMAYVLIVGAAIACARLSRCAAAARRLRRRRPSRRDADPAADRVLGDDCVP
ncbi:hypothetical protein [Sphingomonas oligophenolica]|uniref:hypothetical protein n=1 Tax=Sphingomonas oligophenolica TaxID=301154 RepID=UPI0011273AB9|nr:hypothetical protein [Sphingomonas oligophenolica]